MTDIILTGVLIVVLGNILGRSLKTMNPFYILLGFFFCVYPYYSTFGMMQDNTLQNTFFVVGIISGIFKNPLNAVFSPFELIMVNLRLALARRRAAREEKEGFSKAKEDFRRQAQEKEEQFHKQKDDIEEELRRRKAQADEENRRKAEELRRKEEELNRRAQRERKESAGGSGTGERILDPTKLEDAYKILGVEAGLSLDEYKKARDQIAKQYHPNFVNHLGQELKDLAEEKMKLINVAFDTVRLRY